jgi:O-antigen/teichoic acid export membrane protein
MAAISICGLALNLGLAVILIPQWGVVGAGLSISAAYVFIALVESLWFVRVSRVAHRELLPRIADVRAVLAGIRSR